MKICIDSGHNYDKFDTGAIGNGLKEQNVTFEIADKLKTLLMGAGIGVTMTRAHLTDNVGKNAKDSINERARIANTTKCDLFVSIHCNAGGGTGTETLIVANGGKAEDLAKCVNDRIVKSLSLKNRGVKARSELGVLRLTNMPAILVETAFIDNKSDAVLLKDKKDDFAKAIFDGIMEFTESEDDIIDKLSRIIQINDKQTARKQLMEEKEKNSSLYWILYKIANK